MYVVINKTRHITIEYVCMYVCMYEYVHVELVCINNRDVTGSGNIRFGLISTIKSNLFLI